MIHTFTVPKRDYASIQKYAKKGRMPEMTEVVGRVYESDIGDGIIATAWVSDLRPEIVYTITDADAGIFQKTSNDLSCNFDQLGIILAFEIDVSYE